MRPSTAHQATVRQRGEGSRPSGNSSNKKLVGRYTRMLHQNAPRPRGEPRRRLAEDTPAETAREPELGVVPREGAEAYRDAHAAEDPTYGVAGLAGGDDGAYHREGERQDGQRDQAVVWTLWNARPGHQSEREPAHEQHH